MACDSQAFIVAFCSFDVGSSPIITTIKTFSLGSRRSLRPRSIVYSMVSLSIESRVLGAIALGLRSGEISAGKGSDLLESFRSGESASRFGADIAKLLDDYDDVVAVEQAAEARAAATEPSSAEIEKPIPADPRERKIQLLEQRLKDERIEISRLRLLLGSHGIDGEKPIPAEATNLGYEAQPKRKFACHGFGGDLDKPIPAKATNLGYEAQPKRKFACHGFGGDLDDDDDALQAMKSMKTSTS